MFYTVTNKVKEVTMISPVSFASTTPTTTQSFQDKIKQPQAYIKKEPAAATDIKGKEKKNKSFFSKLIKFVGIAAAIGGSIALGSKFGLFKSKEGGNEIINTVKCLLDTAGTKINSSFAKIFSKNTGEKIVEKGKDIADDAAEQAKTVLNV